MITAHIAGIPVEETLLVFAPVGAAGVGYAGWRPARILHLRRPRDPRAGG